MSDAEYFARQRFLSQHGITPIWFPHARFDLIQALLELFAPPAAPTPPPRRNRRLSGADDTLLAHATGFFGRTCEVEAVLQFLRGAEDMATVTPGLVPSPLTSPLTLALSQKGRGNLPPLPRREGAGVRVGATMPKP